MKAAICAVSLGFLMAGMAPPAGIAGPSDLSGQSHVDTFTGIRSLSDTGSQSFQATSRLALVSPPGQEETQRFHDGGSAWQTWERAPAGDGVLHLQTSNDVVDQSKVIDPMAAARFRAHVIQAGATAFLFSFAVVVCLVAVRGIEIKRRKEEERFFARAVRNVPMKRVQGRDW